MNKTLYPGAFDPITNGHIDVIEQSLKLSNEVYVVVAINRDKTHMFSLEERAEMVKISMKNIDKPVNKKIHIVQYEGIISELAMELGIDAMVRGIRNSMDLQYELDIEQFTKNSTLKVGGIQTIYFTPEAEHIFTSSTLVRNLIKTNNTDNLNKFLDDNVVKYIRKIKSNYFVNDKHKLSYKITTV